MAPLHRSAVSLVVSYADFLALSAVVVVLRFISIRILRRQIKLHDILCVVSLVSRGRMSAPELRLGEVDTSRYV